MPFVWPGIVSSQFINVALCNQGHLGAKPRDRCGDLSKSLPQRRQWVERVGRGGLRVGGGEGCWERKGGGGGHSTSDEREKNAFFNRVLLRQYCSCTQSMNHVHERESQTKASERGKRPAGTNHMGQAQGQASASCCHTHAHTYNHMPARDPSPPSPPPSPCHTPVPPPYSPPESSALSNKCIYCRRGSACSRVHARLGLALVRPGCPWAVALPRPRPQPQPQPLLRLLPRPRHLAPVPAPPP